MHKPDFVYRGLSARIGKLLIAGIGELARPGGGDAIPSRTLDGAAERPVGGRTAAGACGCQQEGQPAGQPSHGDAVHLDALCPFTWERPATGPGLPNWVWSMTTHCALGGRWLEPQKCPPPLPIVSVMATFWLYPD